MMNNSFLFSFEKGHFSPRPRVLVVGGLGKMGAIFADLFRRANCDVFIADFPDFLDESHEKFGDFFVETQTSLAFEMTEKSDIVVLAVSLLSMAEVIKKYAPYVSRGALLFDVASVKSSPVELMQKYAHEGVEILGTHPLFGPIPNILGQTMVLCPMTSKSFWLPAIQSFFEHCGLISVVVTAEEHDKNTAFTQPLLHAVLLAFVATLVEKKKNVEQVGVFATTFFRVQSALASRILSQKSELFSQIAFQNKHALSTMKTFAAVFNDFVDCLEKGNVSDYEKMIEKLNPAYLSLERAYESSKKLLQYDCCLPKK